MRANETFIFFRGTSSRAGKLRIGGQDKLQRFFQRVSTVVFPTAGIRARRRNFGRRFRVSDIERECTFDEHGCIYLDIQYVIVAIWVHVMVLCA